MTRQRLVVVGNGMASLRLLEEIVKRAPGRFAITVIGAEATVAYNRVLLPSLLTGEIGSNDILLRGREWYAANGIELFSGQTALAIKPRQRKVLLKHAAAVSYDVLVLATGSDPITLAVPGIGLPGVATFRTLADVASVERFVASGRPAVVIGGGLLGIEAAYGLARRGVAVSLVHLVDRLMERQLDAEGSALLADTLAGKGIQVMLGAATRAIRGASEVEAVELSDGRLLPCGLAVMAIGIRPCSSLAAGHLRVERGIVVDDRMHSSIEHVYAIGECPEHRGLCYGLVEPCYEQARVAAANILGDTAVRYPGSVLASSLKVSEVPVFSIGAFEGAVADSIIVRDAGVPSYRKLVLADGRLTGAVLVGDVADASWYAELVRSGASVAAFRDQLAFGRAFAEAA
jgi:nitrite reductase (NADH) large subunit